MRVGIISDTHGLLRPEALVALRDVEYIIHAGDVGDPDIVPRLEEIAPVSAIRGNIDHETWAEVYPETLFLELEGHCVHVLHDINTLALDLAKGGISLVVFGHSHKVAVERAGGVLRLNPGSAGPRRFRLPVTLATLEIAQKGIGEPEIHRLLP